MPKSRECIYCDDFFLCNHDGAGNCIMYNTTSEVKRERHAKYMEEFYKQEREKRP